MRNLLLKSEEIDMGSKNNNFIWLFGENVSETANNNSYYFWRHVCLIDDGIDKYIILKKNANNLRVYNSLSKKEKKFVVWRNSFQHHALFNDADLFFVTLSYKDVMPDKFLWKKVDFALLKPVIYLQHGTLGIKSIGYKGWGYNNNFFRFIYYNKNIKPVLMKKNEFRDYQLYYGEYPPRYMELVKRYLEYSKQPKEGKEFLWFPTWREYFGNNVNTNIYTIQMCRIFENEQLAEYLERTNSNITVCLHQFFDEAKIQTFKESCKTEHIKFIHASNVDVLDEIARNDVLITDYSSVGFDFTTLNKPVILYQNDLQAYLSKRSLYCTIEELKQYSVSKEKEFVDIIVNEKYSINEFFKSRLPDTIDFDYISKGCHIDRMYNYFAKIQKNKISFFGYNFYGIGGTVYATRALAEGLLEKNYLVELVSLKATSRSGRMPFGLNLKPLYIQGNRKKSELIKRLIPKTKHTFGYIYYDCSKEFLIPYTNYAMKKLMKNIRSKTIISTRESLHLYFDKCTSDYVKNKVCFFHCTPDLIRDLYPESFDRIKNITLDKVVFVTEESRRGYNIKENYSNYKDHIVLGNALEILRSVSLDDIKPNIPEVAGQQSKEVCAVETPVVKFEDRIFRGIYLIRISEERVADLNHLIGFAEFLRERNINNIVIDVYGSGNYLNEFIKTIYDKELEDYICYCGSTGNPKLEIRKHNAVVDFTLKHSFGMPYIEAILNGKMLFCADNAASREVLEGIEGCIYTSYEDLLEKIKNFYNITPEQLYENYAIISKTYSREAVTEKFLEFIGE